MYVSGRFINSQRASFNIIYYTCDIASVFSAVVYLILHMTDDFQVPGAMACIIDTGLQFVPSGTGNVDHLLGTHIDFAEKQGYVMGGFDYDGAAPWVSLDKSTHAPRASVQNLRLVMVNFSNFEKTVPAMFNNNF